MSFCGKQALPKKTFLALFKQILNVELKNKNDKWAHQPVNIDIFQDHLFWHIHGDGYVTRHQILHIYTFIHLATTFCDSIIDDKLKLIFLLRQLFTYK